MSRLWRMLTRNRCTEETNGERPSSQMSCFFRGKTKKQYKKRTGLLCLLNGRAPPIEDQSQKVSSETLPRYDSCTSTGTTTTLPAQSERSTSASSHDQVKKHGKTKRGRFLALLAERYGYQCDDPNEAGSIYGHSACDFRSCRSLCDLDGLEKGFVDWWTELSEANVQSVKDLGNAVLISKLQSVHVVHGTKSPSLSPAASTMEGGSSDAISAAEDHSRDFYTSTSFLSVVPSQNHVELWLTFQNASMVLHSEVMDTFKFEQCFQPDCMMKRLKIILNPINLSLPVKSARNTRYAGVSFGKQNVTFQHSTSDDSQHVSMQINLASKWVVKIALQKVLQIGNQMDFLLVDWPGQVVVSAVRITVTPALQELMK